MKRFVLIAVAGLALAYPAFAQSMNEKMGVNDMLGIAPKTEDFVKKAATSDVFEIQSSQLAEATGGDQPKSFAAQMATNHQRPLTN